MKLILKILLTLAALYCLFIAALFILAARAPEKMAKVLSTLPTSDTPGPAWMVIPLKPIMLIARAGRLRVGDPAPDFRLRALGPASQEVQLSSLRGKPVVLVFGSYT